MSFIIKNLSYIHPDKELLFSSLHLSINTGEKIAIVGRNGCGKSTLLQLLAGHLNPSSGLIQRSEHNYYVPQHFGQYNRQTIAQALKIDRKQSALHAILNGDTADKHFETLDDDWNIEERAQAALASWEMGEFPLSHPMETLSGGEKTRIFLAGIELHEPNAILLDEPSNHLDTNGREHLYRLIQQTLATVVVVSHDRTLLNLLPTVCELAYDGLTSYSGNYDFYKEQKTLQQNALTQQLEEKQKALRTARKVAKEMEERKNKQDMRGEKASKKMGIPHILMGKRKNDAQNSGSRLNNLHAKKMERLQSEMADVQKSLTRTSKLQTDFNASQLHKGKILIEAKEINFHYSENTPSIENLWPVPISFQVKSGNRISLCGNNGCGKTTLLKLMMGELQPTNGIMERSEFTYVYLDQEYTIICNEQSVFQQVETFNHRHLPEHELKIILNRYLFPYEMWNKTCGKLSGGEKMRLSLCCLMIADNTPDVFILDEPTNNLDIDSIDILTDTMREYTGTVITVSHDQMFLNEIGIEHEILLRSKD